MDKTKVIRNDKNKLLRIKPGLRDESMRRKFEW